VSVLTPYVVPPTPPAELLAELDAAALALDELSARAAELTLAMDEGEQGLRIVLREHGTSRPLAPSELFELLTRS
jgi:hypothetical protein